MTTDVLLGRPDGAPTGERLFVTRRPYAVRVTVLGRRAVWGRYVSLRAAHAEAAKLKALGWRASVGEER